MLGSILLWMDGRKLHGLWHFTSEGEEASVGMVNLSYSDSELETVRAVTNVLLQDRGNQNQSPNEKWKSKLISKIRKKKRKEWKKKRRGLGGVEMRIIKTRTLSFW